MLNNAVAVELLVVLNVGCIILSDKKINKEIKLLLSALNGIICGPTNLKHFAALSKIFPPVLIPACIIRIDCLSMGSVPARSPVYS